MSTLKGHFHHSEVSSVAFSHDSSRLASASDSCTVKIWNARSGACPQTLEGHRREVSFSHDSTQLASASWNSASASWREPASYDRTVKIWDASSGACLQTLKGYGRINNTVGFETQLPLHQGIAISSDKTWITHNEEVRLWLPSEYRPYCSAISGRHIGTGTGSGKIWIYCLK